MVNFINSKFIEFLPITQAYFTLEYSSDIYQSYLARSLAQRRVTTQPSSPPLNINKDPQVYLPPSSTNIFYSIFQKFYAPSKRSPPQAFVLPSFIRRHLLFSSMQRHPTSSNAPPSSFIFHALHARSVLTPSKNDQIYRLP